MKFDRIRDTFKQKNGYSAVYLQQGRVQLDSDWNEQMDITSHRIETETIDTIGVTGAPIGNAGYGITPVNNDLQIGPGRYYVNGMLCENEQVVSILKQPNIPAIKSNKSIVLSNNLAALNYPPPAGDYIVYLDVWKRLITALEDPYIREKALGGPDTAVRTKNIWQVKLLGVNKGTNCLTDPDAWKKLIAAPDGKLSAQAKVDDTIDTPCIVKPGAGYRRLENQLYRVEIHKAGTQGNATFKFSRDNGTVEVSWLAQDVNSLTVSSLGRDKYLGFASGQWIELFDDSNELYNTPGLLVKVVKASDNVIEIDPSGQTVKINDFPDNPRIRRWDSEKDILIPADNSWVELEDGVQVKFSNGYYSSEQYWLVPARSITGDVEWDKDASGNPVALPPFGITHNYCRLAIANFDGKNWTVSADCRNLFPPATGLVNLFYLSGDGQEAMPSETLPESLRVRVSNGGFPVKEAKISFTVIKGGGTLTPVSSGSTDQFGIAACTWKLGSAGDQEVTAVLLDAAGNGSSDKYIVFNAKLSIASTVKFDTKDCDKWSDVSKINTVQDAITDLCKRKVFAKDVVYDPGCNDLKDTTNVQDAINKLCKLLRVDPGIHVTEIKLAGGESLENDSNVQVGNFIKGIEIICDGPLEPGTVNKKPVCYVTIFLPYPLSKTDKDLWDLGGILGHQPLVLDAECIPEDRSILWKLKDTKGTGLVRLFNILREFKLEERILTRLSVQGNFIWSAKDKKLYLDGEVFGIQDGKAADQQTMLRLPSGDGILGGDLNMWFYLVPTVIRTGPPVVIPGEKENVTKIDTKTLVDPPVEKITDPNIVKKVDPPVEKIPDPTIIKKVDPPVEKIPDPNIVKKVDTPVEKTPDPNIVKKVDPPIK